MSFMAAPVICGTSTVGVVRCSTPQEVPYYFSDDDLELLRVVAAQISRCWRTWSSRRQAAERLRRANQELREHMTEVAGTFEDLTHQLRGPLLQAERQVSFALDRASGSSDREELFAVRGLCRRAKRVTLSIDLLAESSESRSKRFNPAALDYRTLKRMLTETAEDHQILADPGHPVRFSVNHNSYDVKHIHRFRVDYDLFEQAISNLLDNASKYSFTDSTVQIHGGLTGTGNLHISVANQGIKLRREDRKKCATRGWRSDEAILCADLGRGIGLWVVDRIMGIHGGELVVEPTNRDGVTEFKLVFRPHKE